MNLFCSYNIVSTLLTKFSLVVEHGKSEVFHFSRSHENFNPPPLDLSLLRGPTLLSKNTWQYPGFYFNLLGAVHTRVEVCRMDSEMSRLVEWPWLQLICYTVCLLCGYDFRCWEEVRDESECWLVCCHWTLEIEFNKRLSLSIIRLANYSVTTSFIHKLIV